MSGGAGHGSITARLFGIAERDGDRELVVDPVYGRFSYGDIAGQVERLACALRAHDLGPGDVVVLQLPNWTPFLVFHLALTAIGAVTATIPLVYRERELRSVLRMTEARALVVPAAFHGFDYAAMAGALRSEASSLRQVFLVGGGAPGAGRGIFYEMLLREPWEALGRGVDHHGPGPDDLTALGFTSGTTGELKGAMYSSRVLDATNRGLADRYHLDGTERIFGCSPLGHAVGFTHALRMTLTVGGCIVLLERWDPARALELIRAERCTFMACATPFLMDLVYHPALRSSGSLESVRVFLCGGASVPEKLMRDARATLPHTFTSPLWGMTECGGVTTCPLNAPEVKLHTTDGLPCDSMEVTVVDPRGQHVPPGVDGELLVRGPMLTLGYFRRPELTREVFQADGFFRTGDQARMDADGYIKITGRIKDLIIRGGVNISPVEVESVLFSHPRVADVAVVGMPDSRLGERICAFVRLSAGDGLGLEEVRQWMQQAGVARQKWPERVEVMDSLPMTASGKVQKFRLRELISERLEGEASGQVVPAGPAHSGSSGR